MAYTSVIVDKVLMHIKRYGAEPSTLPRETIQEAINIIKSFNIGVPSVSGVGAAAAALHYFRTGSETPLRQAFTLAYLVLSSLRNEIRSAAKRLGLDPATLAALVAYSLENIAESGMYIPEYMKLAVRHVLAGLGGPGAEEIVRRFASDVLDNYRTIFTVMMSTEFNEGRVSDAYRQVEKHAESIIRYIVEAASSTQPFGIVAGVRPMRSIGEIRDLAPSERALLYYSRIQPAIAPYVAYRLASGQAMVYDRRIRTQPILFIDMSGSMQNIVSVDGTKITRYELAAALAEATIRAYRGGQVYVFNTGIANVNNICREIMGSNDIQCVADILRSIEPTGGTDISTVLATIVALDEAARRRHEKPFYIVFTDAEDTVSNIVLNAVARRRDLWRRVLVVHVGDTAPEWLHHLQSIHFRRDASLRRVVEKLAKAIVATRVPA